MIPSYIEGESGIMPYRMLVTSSFFTLHTDGGCFSRGLNKFYGDADISAKLAEDVLNVLMVCLLIEGRECLCFDDLPHGLILALLFRQVHYFSLLRGNLASMISISSVVRKCVVVLALGTNVKLQ